jgi:hypothetical protein
MVNRQIVFKVDLDKGGIKFSELKDLVYEVSKDVEGYQFVDVVVNDKFIMVGFNPDNQ